MQYILNISSEILVCRPGSNPLCGFSGGAMANNKLFTIWYMQQHGSIFLPEDTHSSLALSYIISRFC